MSKKLNTDAIASELRGSVFFPESSVREEMAVRETPDRAIVRPNDRTPERPPAKRIITRNSFETYEDQMDSLREIAYLEKRAGKVGSMSAMVREAIDDFLVKKRTLLKK